MEAGVVVATAIVLEVVVGDNVRDDVLLAELVKAEGSTFVSILCALIETP